MCLTRTEETRRTFAALEARGYEFEGYVTKLGETRHSKTPLIYKNGNGARVIVTPATPDDDNPWPQVSIDQLIHTDLFVEAVEEQEAEAKQAQAEAVQSEVEETSLARL